ncbi:hypothetical protein SAMN04490202_0618 [Pseudomonas reinekei]|jgi:hypothetical protein|uniref:Uncharacterized protein n=1 Tax=Pseudomonas reinekei TaxID=395598 RepID=A0A1H0IPY3_PSERE|nr:hypothetical protein [Pseudomonas reinekei]KAB0486658.1 hypothetical protein F7R15_07185 [Pseudomonas reinekei]OLU04344.1 hypothetical protein BVK86_08890 [Pseudomonas reinekei]SDO33529.1 hypothetical protein SAMN04490202_0618 [Pseudomonas reinekei]
MKTLLAILAALAAAPGIASADASNNSNNPEFTELFQKELTNRATARKAADIFRNRDSGEGQAEFWGSYYRLEEITLSIYTPVAKELSLEPNNFMAGIKSYAAAAFQWIAPEKFVGTLQGATAKYLEELKSSKTIVPLKHSAFYEYVLDQEDIQVKALSLAQQHNYQDAKSLVDSFAECAIKKTTDLAAECSAQAPSSDI